MSQTFNVGETYPINEDRSVTILDKHEPQNLYLLKYNGSAQTPSRCIVCYRPSFENGKFEWASGHYFDSEVYGCKHPLVEAANYFQDKVREYELENSEELDLSFKVSGKINGIDCRDYFDGDKSKTPKIQITYRTPGGEIKKLYHSGEDHSISEAGYAPKLYLTDIYTVEAGEKKCLSREEWQKEIAVIESVEIPELDNSLFEAKIFEFITPNGDIYPSKTELAWESVTVKNGSFKNLEFQIPLKTLMSSVVDIDVRDDIAEVVDMAITGPIELTEEGKWYYKDILDEQITVNPNYRTPFATTNFSQYPKDKQRQLLSKFKDFMLSQAGYCDELKNETLFVYPKMTDKYKTLDDLIEKAQKKKQAQLNKQQVRGR